MRNGLKISLSMMSPAGFWSQKDPSPKSCFPAHQESYSLASLEQFVCEMATVTPPADDCCGDYRKRSCRPYNKYSEMSAFMISGTLCTPLSRAGG